MKSTHKTEGSRCRPLDPAAAARVIAYLCQDEPDAPGKNDLPEISGYRLERRLSAGGQGEVFVGRREGSDQPVVIKLSHTRLDAGPESLLAFRELEHLKQSRLPCLPSLFDYGTCDGRLFIVMVYIDGRAIDQHCDERGLGLRERAALLAKAATSVHALNDRGIIHRDLKPQHILVTLEGDIVLLDLGIAKSLKHDTSVTLTSVQHAVGTPDFMAPEQACGEQATIRSDVCALGAVGYLVLTGNKPRDLGRTLPEALRRVVETPPRDPQSLNPDIPRDLAAILSKATALDPDDRYTSAADLAADLEHWLAGRPVVAVPPTRWRRATEWGARHPVAVTTGVCALIAVVSLAATYASVWWLNRRAFGIRLAEGVPSHAWLIARSGNILHEWGDARVNRFSFGMLADRPAALGGGRVALLALGNRNQLQLCAFDSRQPDRLLWSSGDEPGRGLTIPDRPGFVAESVFSVEHVQVVDLFPELPGAEIIALHRHVERAASTVRIYDLAGTVLFEAWHFGWFYDAYWLSDPGVLILLAVNSEALWRCRSDADVGSDQSWPYVVMGIKPVAGQHRGWITTPDRCGDFTTEWYRCVLPAAAYPGLRDNRPQLSLPGGGRDPGQYFDLDVDYMTLSLNGQGVVIQPPLVMAARLQHPNPDPAIQRALESITLGDLPPIDPALGSDCQARND